MASRASGSVRGGLSLVGGGGDGTTTAGGGGPGGGASGPVTTLLQALNASACGRDAAPILGAAFEDVLRGCAGGPGGPPLVRVLAYEGARSARPGTLAAGDWEAVVEAAEADLAPGSAAPGEVQAAALAALAALPADAVGLAAGSGAGPGASGCIVPALQAGPPAARPAAARAAAVLLTRDAWLTSPGGAEAAAAAAAALGDALLDEDDGAAAAAAGALADAWAIAESGRGGGSLAAVARSAALRPVAAAVVAALPAILDRAVALPPAGAADVARCVAGALAFSAAVAAGAAAGLEGEAPPDGTSPPPPPPAWAYSAASDFAARLATASPDSAAALDGAVSLARVATLAAASPSPPAWGGGAVADAAASGAAAPAAAAAAAPVAAAALIAAWPRPGLEAARPQVAAALGGLLPALPPLERATAARTLLALAGDLAASAHRAAACAAAWHALVSLDLWARGARRAAAAAGSSAPPLVAGGGELRAALASAEVGAAIADDPASLPPACPADGGDWPPAYREELVATLLAVVRAVPAAGAAERAARAALRRAAAAEAAAAPGVAAAAFVPGLGEAGASGEADDWLGTARIALQGTRACLGWEVGRWGGGAGGGGRGGSTTAPVDAWLGLLGSALRAARALCPPAAAAAAAAASPPTLQSQASAVRTTADGPAASTPRAGAGPGPAPLTPREGVGKAAAQPPSLLPETPPTGGGGASRPPPPPAPHRAALQALLRTLLIHWKALPPPARPRALGTAVAGLDLPAHPDARWALLLRAAEEQLDRGAGEGRDGRRAAGRGAAGAGYMSGPAAAAAAAAAVAAAAAAEAAAAAKGSTMPEGGAGGLASANPFAAGGPSSSSATAPTASASTPTFPSPIDPPDAVAARAEAGAAGLAAIEAAARRVAADLGTYGGRPGLLELARGIAAVAGPHAAADTGASSAGPEARDRAGRVVAALSAAAAAAPPPPAPPGESDDSDLEDAAAVAAAAAASAAAATPPERSCLDALAPGGVGSAPDGPLGPPTGPALRAGPPGARYAALSAAVEAAVRGVVGGGGGGFLATDDIDDDAVGVPGVLELARLAAGGLPASAAAAAAGGAAGGGPRQGLVSLLPLAAAAAPALDGCASYELTAPGDPVRVAILAADLDAPGRAVALRLEATNRGPADLPPGGASVALQWSGAAVGAGRGRGGLPLPPLAPGESHVWRAGASLTGPGPASVGVVVDLSSVARRAHGGAGDAPACLRGPLRFAWGPADWLAVPGGRSSPPSITRAGPFFKAWVGAPGAGAATATCARPGQAGPPALLGALARGGRLAPAWVAPLPAQAGFVAALAGVSPLSGWPVLVVASARLAAVESGSGSERGGGWGGGGVGGGRLATAPPPASSSLFARLPPHATATFEARTRCPAMAAGIAADPAGFVGALAGGELAPSTTGGGSTALALGGGAPVPPPPGRPAAVGSALAALCGRGVVPDAADVAAAAVGGLDGAQAAAEAAAVSEWRRLVGAAAAAM